MKGRKRFRKRRARWSVECYWVLNGRRGIVRHRPWPVDEGDAGA